ncbi:MAG: nucleotidyltransferase family protein [Candidatus Woesearchaeota archaeon]
MRVIIPAAGYATRLYPLTLNQPKHLLDVNGKPIIEYVVRKIEELENVNEIFIVSNAKFFANFDEWSKSYKCNIPLHILNDGTTSHDDKLGTIGDIKFVMDQAGIDDDLLVLSGDNLFNFSLEAVNAEFSRTTHNINAVYDIQSVEDAKQLGVVTLGKDSKIVGFQEKPSSPKSTLISMGIYFFPRKNVQLISEYVNKGNNPDKMGYFMEWLIANDVVYGFIYKEKWFDIGNPNLLEQARKEFTG